MGNFVLDALRTPTMSIQTTSPVPPPTKYGPSQVSFGSLKPLPVPPLGLKRSKFNTTPVPVIKPLPVPWKRSNIDATHVVLNKQFDEFKVDAGITSIPRIFHQPPDNLAFPRSVTQILDIPVINLASGDRSVVVRQVQEAAYTVGFFQIINHGVPLSLMDDVILTIKTGLGPQPAESRNVRGVRGKAVAEWDEATKKLGDVLLDLMSEGFGLKREALEEKLCMEARIMAGNHYPYYPQTDLSVGLKSHTDPVLFTLLLSNQIPGLQVKVEGHEWVNLVAHPGALVLNVGDFLQIISNDKYKSVEHRVLANSFEEPRLLVPAFFNPANNADTYGPLPQITSPDEPAHYHDLDLFELGQQIKKEVGAKSLINNCSTDQNSKRRDWNPPRYLHRVLLRIP